MMLSSAEREILLAAFESNDWIDLYDLHKHFMLSPGQVFAAVSKFKEMGILESRDLFVRLTVEGRRWIVKNRASIFFAASSRPWAQCLGRSGADPWDPAAPYLPDLRRLDIAFFNRR